MRDFLATIIALIIIFATIWGLVAALVMSVNFLSSIGIPSGMLYFSGGIAFSCIYKKMGRWFANYCDVVWQKIQEWVVWR